MKKRQSGKKPLRKIRIRYSMFSFYWVVGLFIMMGISLNLSCCLLLCRSIWCSVSHGISWMSLKRFRKFTEQSLQARYCRTFP